MDHVFFPWTLEKDHNTNISLPLHTYPPEPLDDNVIRVVLSLVDSVVPPVLDINWNDATHEQLQFILVEQSIRLVESLLLVNLHSHS